MGIMLILSKIPLQNPCLKAPTFPPSGGYTTTKCTFIFELQSSFLANIVDLKAFIIAKSKLVHKQGPKAHPPPLGIPLFIWNPLNLKHFDNL